MLGIAKRAGCVGCVLFVLAIPAYVGADPGSRARVPVVEQWSRFEARYTPVDPPSNPFDPAVIDVRAEFEGPGGERREVTAFWYQDFERRMVDGREQLVPKGGPHFRVRFTPDRPGRWRWRWVVRTPDRIERFPVQQLQVKGAPGRGFLRLSDRDPRHLAFDDRSPFFAVGENTGWYDERGTFAFDDWFAALAAQDANFARIWMASWAFGLEWNDTGLGDYSARLDRAWQLDHVLEEAQRKDIYVMITLLNHGAFSTLINSEWDQNPFNQVNGGPLATPSEFFTDDEARMLFERRLRYVVARWGWSTHVLAWELWNEVELTDGYSSTAVAAWHAHMTERLRALDPHDHLVTTSHAVFPNDPVVWRDGGIDFTQLHFYANTLPRFRNVAATVVDFTRNRLDATGKPVLFAELGVDFRGPVETRAADPEGIGVHDGLWAGVVSGGFGTAMTWWWDNLIAVEPDRYYPMFGAVARFVDGVRWDREGFEPAIATVTASRPIVPYGIEGDRTLLLWLKDDAYQWYSPDAVEVTDATLSLDGDWCGRWYDPWGGGWLDDVEIRGPTDVPPFSRDLALRATRCTTPR